MAGRWHPTRVLAWLLATACAAHAGEATEAASATADQFKLMIGSMLMSDYIYRGISYSAHQPSVATYIDDQQGWLYGYTNFNSVRFSTSPAVEVTMAVGARPTSVRSSSISARLIIIIPASSGRSCPISGRRTSRYRTS